MRPGTVDWRDGVRDRVLELISNRVASDGFFPSLHSNTFLRERCSIVDSVCPLFDCSSIDNRVLCSLNIGICCKELCFAPCRSLEQRRKSSALTWNIGYLMVGRWVEWSAGDVDEIDSVITEILHCFDDVAMPWLGRFKTSRDVRRELSQNQPTGFMNLQRRTRRHAVG